MHGGDVLCLQSDNISVANPTPKAPKGSPGAFTSFPTANEKPAKYSNLLYLISQISKLKCK